MTGTSKICNICDQPITDDDWTYGLFGNGPIHNRHRHSDDELRAMLDDPEPCTGCETCCQDCQSIDGLHYADGYDNASIYRYGDQIHVDRVLPLAGVRDRMDPLVAPESPRSRRCLTIEPREVGTRFTVQGCEYVVTSVEPCELGGWTEDAEPVSLN